MKKREERFEIENLLTSIRREFGDEVKVIVKNVNLLKRQMDFELILEDTKRKAPKKKRRS